ncbi:hypothetical protein J2128_002451 [Methanomicrobium sp. W14]|jgi:hypothetical protein|uniref:hypothetical protein n=1 Tax=Methanomicrobium sp. W14 TaxID=2817839 RepID=UPI001AEA9C37|nr:hypothetical protein [Methanomicrobium sp. W14]MBP2134485.1 hypothetical protein [Methanomicrobium sp. W14]
MSAEILIIAGLGILNIVFIFIIWVMYVRIKQLLGDVEDLKSRMEFSDSEIETLAEAVRGISGVK